MLDEECISSDPVVNEIRRIHFKLNLDSWAAKYTLPSSNLCLEAEAARLSAFQHAEIALVNGCHPPRTVRDLRPKGSIPASSVPDARTDGQAFSLIKSATRTK